jgi:hypothetical protein
VTLVPLEFVGDDALNLVVSCAIQNYYVYVVKSLPLEDAQIEQIFDVLLYCVGSASYSAVATIF